MKIDQTIFPAIDHIDGSNEVSKNRSSEKNSRSSESFSDMLIKSVEKVNRLQKEADEAINELVLGDNKDIVQTMIKMEKADISFKLMMQIRNKIVQAYEEIMRMQV